MRHTDVPRGLPAATLTAALTLAVASAPTHAAWFADGTLESSYDSNPALAETAADIEGEMSVGARVSGGWYQQLTDRIGLSATADVAGEHHAQFTGLDYVGIGGSVGSTRRGGSWAATSWRGITTSTCAMACTTAPAPAWASASASG